MTETGVVVCLEVELGTEIGLDYYSYTVSDQFLGFSQVPPGLHIFYHSVGGASGGPEGSSVGGPRTSFFFQLQPGEIKVLQWNRESEQFCIVEQLSLIQEYHHKFNTFQLLKRLAPYPMDTHGRWLSLSNCITMENLDKLEPPSSSNKMIVSTLGMDGGKEEELEEQAILKKYAQEFGQSNSNMKPSPSPSQQQQYPSSNGICSSTLFFSTIPKLVKQKGLSSEQLTRMNIDKSELLVAILQKEYPHNHRLFLGELQFAYICFLIAQRLDAFEQWKSMIELLCNCESALTSHCDLFVEFVKVLQAQMETIPADLFVDSLSAHSFLNHCLINLFELVGVLDTDDPSVPGQLQQATKKLKSIVQKRFKWNPNKQLDLAIGEYNDDDYAPVIVDLAED